MRALGLLIVAAAMLMPGVWFADIAARHDSIAAFSQYLGCTALIAMSFCQIFATRIKGLESVFGGMDRIYVLHKWLGIVAMVLIVLHDTIDAQMDGLGRETVVTEIAETLGEFSLYGLLILATLSIATFVPYHLWKYTHKAMGGFFACATLHYLFIQKPFAVGDPLGIYISVFCLVGVLAYAYTLLPVSEFRNWRRYVVAEVKETGGALAIVLKPVGSGFAHRPGQFAFLKFGVPGHREVHPFTISKAQTSDRALRFTIKRLGDFTDGLAEVIEPGATAKVSGPFGHFRYSERGLEQVWIASGVGITPFVAWAQALPETAGHVHLFYSVRRRDAAPHLNELEAIAGGKPNLTLHLVETAVEGRLSGARIADVVTSDRRKVAVAFCGPKPMRESFRQQLKAAGFAAGNFQYEEFEIRSGIGLRKFAAWVLSRFGWSEPLFAER
ncbi:MAG: ferredoxin reductase family protein [Hyphomicrobiaceae bacterium]